LVQNDRVRRHVPLPPLARACDQAGGSVCAHASRFNPVALRPLPLHCARDVEGGGPVMTLTLLKPTVTVDEVVGQLDRDGFAVVEHYLSPEDVARKKADLHRILQTVPKGRNDFEGFETRRIYALFAKTRTFDDTATDPLLLGVLERVLGPSFQLSAPVGISIGPDETAQRLHRDENLPIARPHQEMVMNSMWAIDDFTDENEATRVHHASNGR